MKPPSSISAANDQSGSDLLVFGLFEIVRVNGLSHLVNVLPNHSFGQFPRNRLAPSPNEFFIGTSS